MNVIVCNMCGKEFDYLDKQEGFGLHYSVGYGSKFDGDSINCDLCCDCFDRMMREYIIPKCKHSPIAELSISQSSLYHAQMQAYLNEIGEGEWTGEGEDISQ